MAPSSEVPFKRFSFVIKCSDLKNRVFLLKETFYQNVDFLRRRLPFREVALLQMTFKSRQRSNFSTHVFCEILILKSCHIFLTFLD
jgi:hypothetical protein